MDDQLADITLNQIDNIAEYKTANLKCLVPSTSLQLLEVVGKGSIGIVHKAEWSFHGGKVAITC